VSIPSDAEVCNLDAKCDGRCSGLLAASACAQVATLPAVFAGSRRPPSHGHFPRWVASPTRLIVGLAHASEVEHLELAADGLPPRRLFCADPAVASVISLVMIRALVVIR
jgi:hypothetical protein